MKKRLLLFFPNVSNRRRIMISVPVLGGIAKSKGWEISYFDTSFYEKNDDSVKDLEKTGGFKPGPQETISEMLPKEKVVTDLQSVIDDYQPDVIAITTMTCNYQYLMTFFPQIKIPPQTKVIIGGIHATFKEDEVLETNLFDLVCPGQGEASFVEILSKIESGERLDNIPGTIHKNKITGEVTRNPKRMLLPAEKIWEIEEEYSFYNQQAFRYPFDGNTVGMFWIEIGRGCPYACSYCGNSALKEYYKGLGQYIVSRPMDSIFNLIQKVNQKFDVDVFKISHECFLAQPTAWLKEFTERWAKEVRKSFLIDTRAETVTEERLEILKKAGAPIIQAGVGIESGSERILREVCNRTVTTDQVIKAFDLLHKHNFRTAALFMLGFPTETREDIFKTIEVCRKVNADVDSVSIFQPMPGQPLTKICIEKGYITGNEEIPSFTEGSILKMPQISAEEIANLRRTFLLYAKLPKEYWPQIEKCEKDYENNKDLFNELVDLRWKLASKKPKHQFRDPNFN